MGSVKGQGGEEFQLHLKKSQWCINVSRSRSAQCISCLDPESWLGSFVNRPILQLLIWEGDPAITQADKESNFNL